MTRHLVSFHLPDSTKCLTRGLEHIMVNVEAGTWAKVSPPLSQLIVELQQAPLDTLLAQRKSISSTDRNSVLQSLHALAQLQLLDAHIHWDRFRHIRPIRTEASPRVQATRPAGLHVILDTEFNRSSSGSDTSSPSLLSGLPAIAQRLALMDVSSVTLVAERSMDPAHLADTVGVLRREVGAPVHLNLSSTCFTEDLCKRIRYSVQGLFIEMSYPESIHDGIYGRGSFSGTLTAIKHLGEAGIREITILAPVRQDNTAHLQGIVNMAQSLGVGFDVAFALPDGRATLCPDAMHFGTKKEQDLEKQIWRRCLDLDFPGYPSPFYTKYIPRPKVACSIGNTLCVLSDGAMYPCQPLAWKRKYYLGNILEMKPPQTSSIGHTKRRIEQHVDDNPRLSRCPTCNVRYFCGGYCLGRKASIEVCARIRMKLARRLWSFDGTSDLKGNATSMFRRQA